MHRRNRQCWPTQSKLLRTVSTWRAITFLGSCISGYVIGYSVGMLLVDTPLRLKMQGLSGHRWLSTYPVNFIVICFLIILSRSITLWSLKASSSTEQVTFLPLWSHCCGFFAVVQGIMKLYLLCVNISYEVSPNKQLQKWNPYRWSLCFLAFLIFLDILINTGGSVQEQYEFSYIIFNTLHLVVLK